MTVNFDTRSFDVVGRVVLFHRKQAGLSRIALAEIAGVGKTVIYDIEHGKPTIRLATLLEVLAALNITLSVDSPLIDRFEAEDHEDS